MSPSTKTAISAVGAASALALVYAVFIEPFAIETVFLDLYSPRLPKEFDEFTILHLSDLHMKKTGRREAILTKILGDLPPADVALVTGDLVHTPRGIAPFLELSQAIRATDGTYVTFGNSEHKNGVRSHAFAADLAAHGMRPLINASTTLTRGSASIVLAGVDDPVTEHDDFHAALGSVPREAFKVLMMHSPDTVSLACAYGVDIVLSGHTHGGQIKLPYYGAPYTHSHLGRAMSHGLYRGRHLREIIGFRPGRTQLYVTRGVGISGLALRFLCRPEITFLTLRRFGSRE
jgi:predicted MPP superfamily phosphohydrolase